MSRYETERQLFSATSALDDVQEMVEEEMAPDLDRLEAGPNQIGVVCTVGDEILGLDLFDRPATLEKYLRSIVAGHALDATDSKLGRDPIRAIERFLADVGGSDRELGPGVGLGDEVLLKGDVAGIGLEYDGSLVHLAAFPGGK